MGNSSSSGYEDENDWDRFDGIETLGYRVLGVQPNSPAAKAGLVSFLDFIVGANDRMLLGSGEGLQEGDEYDDVDFPALLKECQDRPVELLVYNMKSHEARLVSLVPSDDWGGAGLLGVTIRLDNYGGADERLIRVLDVEHNSPAAIAGLVSLQDYLLGTATESFETTDDLAVTLRHHVDRVVEMYVYNTNSDVVRVVSLMPTYSWGGGGLLGAEVGTGYLHTLPLTSRNTSGSSVVRKIRYHHHQQQQQQQQQQPVDPQQQPPSHPSDAGITTSTTTASTKTMTTTAAEEAAGPDHPNASTTSSSSSPIPTNSSVPIMMMEPQLEMEAEQEHDPPSYATPSELADHTQTGPRPPQPPQPQQCSHHQQPQPPPQQQQRNVSYQQQDPAAATAEESQPPPSSHVHNNGYVEASSSAEAPPPPPSPQPPLDAGALFAGPPPGAATSAAATATATATSSSSSSYYMQPPSGTSIYAANLPPPPFSTNQR